MPYLHDFPNLHFLCHTKTRELVPTLFYAQSMVSGFAPPMCLPQPHCPWRAHSPVVTHIPSATSGLNLASGTPADLLKPEGLPRTIIFLGPDVGKASPGAGSFESLTKSLPTHVLIHGPASGELALCSCPSTTTGDVLPDLDTPVVQLHTSGTHSTHRRCHLNTWHYEQVAFV